MFSSEIVLLCCCSFTLLFNLLLDVDECLEGTSGCEHLCNNTVGSFKCSCRHGYKLDYDRKSCTGSYNIVIVDIIVDGVASCCRCSSCNGLHWFVLWNFDFRIWIFQRMRSNSTLRRFPLIIILIIWIIASHFLYRYKWMSLGDRQMQPNLFEPCWWLHMQV